MMLGIKDTNINIDIDQKNAIQKSGIRKHSIRKYGIKKLAAAIFAMLLVTFCTVGSVFADGEYYTNGTTGYEAVIEDDAALLYGDETDSLLESMKPITEYANVIFVTTDSNAGTAEDYADTAGYALFGSEDYVVLLIDMDNRVIYIYSSQNVYKVLDTGKADTITARIYQYASDEEYAQCASEGFELIATVLQGGKVASPIKIIGCAIIALIGGLLICYIIMSSVSSTRIANTGEIEKGMGNKEVSCSNIRKKKISSHVIVITSGGGGGGGGHSGGGGGGGHRF